MTQAQGTAVPDPKVILVNGPPHSGKDTVGEIIREARTAALAGPTHVCKFATVVKRGTHDRLGLFTVDKLGRRRPVAADAFEAVKDQLGVEGFPEGKTPRQCYIEFSEEYAKPKYGQDVFGRILLDQLVKLVGTNEQVVVTDSGFEAEAGPIVDHYGAENVLVVRLHRPGCKFAGDSRTYVDLSHLGDVRHIEVENSGSLEDLAHCLADAEVL